MNHGALAPRSRTGRQCVTDGRTYRKSTEISHSASWRATNSFRQAELYNAHRQATYRELFESGPHYRTFALVSLTTTRHYYHKAQRIWDGNVESRLKTNDLVVDRQTDRQIQCSIQWRLQVRKWADKRANYQQLDSKTIRPPEVTKIVRKVLSYKDRIGEDSIVCLFERSLDYTYFFIAIYLMTSSTVNACEGQGRYVTAPRPIIKPVTFWLQMTP